MVTCLVLAGCGGASQIGADPDAFKAVDALYTAVSLREPDRVDRCVATLASLRDAGKIDGGPLEELEGIAAEAKSGSWEPAQSRLAQFMRGQTRGK
ncbi:hypothetical protein [Paludisphaera rhizosphaerae]|uniref:hypothetical protein n=1 Tax=Paludisphaera rhizosphaerae TaxID=2711216 RepID=UPI001F0EA643|nr:hypothetical protein [Paludisphaera rhizosphaerae]